MKIWNKNIIALTNKAEKFIDRILAKKVYDSKNTLKDRVFMYIFLFTSVTLAMGVIGAQAFTEVDLVKNEVISIEDTTFMKLTVK